jgi:SpoIIAA-like
MNEHTKRHGLSIGIERINDRFFLTLRVVGKLTHKDYGAISPMIESALEGIKEAKIKVFIDASELEGWEMRAAWDDFKLGVKHGKEFEKIALLGNKRWQELATKISSWFISGELKYFEDAKEALNWLED